MGTGRSRAAKGAGEMSEKCVYCGADLGYTGASLHVCDKLMDRGYEGGYQDGYRAGKAEQDREIEMLTYILRNCLTKIPTSAATGSGH